MSSLGVLMAKARPILVTLYLLLAQLAAPFYLVVHLIRCRQGKDDPARSNEKWGKPRIKRPSGPLVWVHAASVGETNSVLPLIDALADRGFFVLLTTVTRTSAKIAAARLPEGAVHQYVPFDSPAFIRCFLKHWQPDLAMTVESEIWPGFFVELRRWQIPLVLVNGRMSDRSFKGWARLKQSAAYIFGCVDLALAQSPADASRLERLGCRQVVCPGNLKFDARPQAVDSSQLEALRTAVGARAVWLAALTHPGEDEIVLAAHRKLLENSADCLLVLVPRHPERGDAIEDLALKRGFKLARRSRGELPSAETEIYLGDTLGEMALFYQLAPIAFLGGSFADVGGHNPVEAAIFEAAILSGPKVANARVLYKALWQDGGAQQVERPEDLSAAVEALFQDEDGRRRQIACATKVAESGRGALDRTLEQLEPLLTMAASRTFKRDAS